MTKIKEWRDETYFVKNQGGMSYTLMIKMYDTGEIEPFCIYRPYANELIFDLDNTPYLLEEPRKIVNPIDLCGRFNSKRLRVRQLQFADEVTNVVLTVRELVKRDEQEAQEKFNKLFV